MNLEERRQVLLSHNWFVDDITEHTIWFQCFFCRHRALGRSFEEMIEFEAEENFPHVMDCQTVIQWKVEAIWDKIERMNLRSIIEAHEL